MTERPDKPLTVRVIRWEGLAGFGWGVDIDHGDGKHDAYPVGPREAADAEAERIRSGGPARSPDKAMRLLKD
jgi:hypothetical protein